jgi:hypothetical protein
MEFTRNFYCFYRFEQQLEVNCIQTKGIKMLELLDKESLLKYNHSFIVCWLNNDSKNKQKSKVTFF